MKVYYCTKCNTNKYKVIYWKLNNERSQIGIYCGNCDKWFKFLRKNEEINGVLVGIEIKNQRASKNKAKAVTINIGV